MLYFTGLVESLGRVCAEYGLMAMTSEHDSDDEDDEEDESVRGSPAVNRSGSREILARASSGGALPDPPSPGQRELNGGGGGGGGGGCAEVRFRPFTPTGNVHLVHWSIHSSVHWSIRPFIRPFTRPLSQIRE